jgi:hypothetical protein
MFTTAANQRTSLNGFEDRAQDMTATVAGERLEEAIRILEKAIDATRLPMVKNKAVAPWVKDLRKGSAESHFTWMGLFWSIKLECSAKDILESKVALAWAIHSTVCTTKVLALKDVSDRSFTDFLKSVKASIPELIVDYAVRTSLP